MRAFISVVSLPSPLRRKIYMPFLKTRFGLKTRLGLFLSVGTLMAATAVPAHAELVSAANPKAIFAIAKAEGYAPEMLENKGSAPSFRMKVNDANSLVLFMNCDDNHANCKTLQFYIGYSASDAVNAGRINDWNREKRFSRAYIDSSGDPVMEMDLDLDFAGLPRENVTEAFNLWAALTSSFSSFIFQEAGAEDSAESPKAYADEAMAAEK